MKARMCSKYYYYEISKDTDINKTIDSKYSNRTKIMQQSSPYYLQCIMFNTYYEQKRGSLAYDLRKDIIQKESLVSFNMMRSVYSEKDIELELTSDFRQSIYPILSYKQQRENINNKVYINPDSFRRTLFIRNSLSDYFYTNFFKSGYQNIHITINKINNILLMNKNKIDVSHLSDKVFATIGNSFNNFVLKNDNLFNMIVELLNNVKSVISDLSITLNVANISNKIKELRSIYDILYFNEDITFSINCFLNYNNLDFIFVTDVLSYVKYFNKEYNESVKFFDFIDIKTITEVKNNLITVIVNYFKSDVQYHDLRDVTLEDLEIEYTLNGERKVTNNFFYTHYEKKLDNLGHLIKKMFSRGIGSYKIKMVIS